MSMWKIVIPKPLLLHYYSDCCEQVTIPDKKNYNIQPFGIIVLKPGPLRPGSFCKTLEIRGILNGVNKVQLPGLRVHNFNQTLNGIWDSKRMRGTSHSFGVNYYLNLQIKTTFFKIKVILNLFTFRGLKNFILHYLLLEPNIFKLPFKNSDTFKFRTWQYPQNFYIVFSPQNLKLST